MNDFKEGDVVRLKTDSPHLVVEMPQSDTIGVVWFVDGIVHRDRLHRDAVVRLLTREEFEAGEK